MSLVIYKWIQPSSRGNRIEYHFVDPSQPKSNPLVLYPAPPDSKRGPIFTTKGQACDYRPPADIIDDNSRLTDLPSSCWLDVLVVTGLTIDTIYREYNKIQDSEDFHLDIPDQP